MPTLPLTGPTPLGGGILPVGSDVDVLAVFPAEVRRVATAPVRDALTAALTEIIKEYQRRSSKAAALSDLLRATGTHLESLCADHDVYKVVGEEDEALRARTLGVPGLVSPVAVLAAVNAILAPYTDIHAKYFEAALDQWFVTDGTASFESFVYDATSGATPYYPDRLFADDAVENDELVREDAEVLGAWVFADGGFRYFVLRIPPIDAIDYEGAFAIDADDDGMFVADGSDTSGAESDGSVACFVTVDPTLSDDIYAAIVGTVETLKGQGIRWQAYVDPLLVG